MEVELQSWLYDIQNAILEIESFLTDTLSDQDNPEVDIKTRRAIERNIEIIGEAVSRILQRDSNIHLSNSRKIVDTRNRIIHGYDSVSDVIIWSIVRQHLPVLKHEVELLLGEK